MNSHENPTLAEVIRQARFGGDDVRMDGRVADITGSRGKLDAIALLDELNREQDRTGTKRRAGPYSLDKVNHYESELGFTYWVDINKCRIATSDPSIFLHMETVTSREEYYQFFVLYFEGLAIAFSGTKDEDLHQAPPKGEDGVTPWRIGRIGNRVVSKNPWFDPGSPPYPPFNIGLTNTNSFDSLEQQNRALALVSELLKHFNGSFLWSNWGRDATGRLEFTAELQEQLNNGDLIK